MNQRVLDFINKYSPVTVTPRDKTSPEEDLLEEARKRSSLKGLSSAYSEVWMAAEASPFGVLSYAELREVYLQSSSVRPCVDTLARYISSLPWSVLPKRGSDIVEAIAVMDFLKDPNSNKESLRTLLEKVLIDILVLDAGIIEKVYSRSGRILELYARDGATFTPEYEEHGVLLGYRQNVASEEIVEFTANEIVHLQLFPRTWDFYGTPIIESITSECATLMFSMASIAEAFTQDEIPPGFLSLKGIGEIAYRKLLADITSEKGVGKKRLRVLRNVDATWIDLKRSFTEMQLEELNAKIEAIVRRNFGFRNAEMDIDPRMIIAIVQTLNHYINNEIVNELNPNVYFKLMPLVIDEKAAKANEADARSIERLFKSDIIDREEARILAGPRFLVPEESLE